MEAMNNISLSKEHVEAANRLRRIIFQYDICQFYVEDMNPEQAEEVKAYFLSPFDETPNQIDSVWYEWGEGNTAPYPSRILPPQHPVFQRWREAGIDPVLLFLEETKKRAKEVFLSYRINGSDNDMGPPELTPLKVERPDLLIRTWYSYWNFAKEEVRDYKLRILEEVALLYDFDGIQIDFARVPVLFAPGEQWKNRDLLTEFMRSVRLMLLEVGQKRGRPFLLAARVPENIMGCHFDGIDVERWAREQLVDILVPGCRSADVDVEAFTRIAAATGIKVYPSWDDHHSSDGYHQAPIEVYRGVSANWRRQGADGIHTFNLCFAGPKDKAERLGVPAKERWDVQRQIYREIGSQETLSGLDKIFYVDRRGGGHHESVVPNAEAWSTPRNMYFNTNMFAPLPAPLVNDGQSDTFLSLHVADDVNAAADSVREITLQLVLSDPAASNLPNSQRLERVVVADFAHPTPYGNSSPAKGIERRIEARINNSPLGPARVKDGWLVFAVEPGMLAVGDNLVGMRVTSRPPGVLEEILVEKLELHVRYC
jgi:hypothetical protein